jgi:membrane protease YdiL (CAAX protease family)
MTAIALPLRARRRIPASAWAEAALITAGLGAIVVARWAATRLGFDPLAVGFAFGAGLVALVLAGGRWLATDRGVLRGLVPGLLFGAALVWIGISGLGLAGGASHVPGLGRPSAPFAPWAVVTVLVAVAEEAVLRGLLFDRITRAVGAAVAVVTTATLFALIHVPLYGWHVVPLDLAVGLALGGLRVLTKGVTAPAAAHALADLVTWWL